MTLFQPYRAAGVVCGRLPISLQARGNEHFVTAAVGTTYHVYNCKKLNLVFVGQCPGPIDAITTAGRLVLTACGDRVFAWNRDVNVQTYGPVQGTVQALLSFGEVVAVLDSANVIRVFNLLTAETIVVLDDFGAQNLTVTSMCHPSTHINKILVGTREGPLQIINIRTRKTLYTIKGWNAPVTCIEQATALDVVAIGLQTGQIVVHNIRADKSLMLLHQDGGPVTDISFRTDDTSYMATAAANGAVTVWDLPKKRVASMMSMCHDGAVASSSFLHSQPLLITSGTDNAIKLWIFDQQDDRARLLKQRSGHSAPPTRIRFYGPEGHYVLSAGQDQSLRSFCVIVDERSCELSQGSVEKRAKALSLKQQDLKLPPIVAFDADPTRELDWDNIVTCHAGLGQAQTWSFDKKVVGKNHLQAPSLPKDSLAKSVCMSACGNFAIVGYSSGHVERFNVQSGQHRSSYKFKSGPAHERMVTAVACDAGNRFVISASSDRTVKFWRFQEGTLAALMKFPGAVHALALQRENNLLAVACEDFVVRIVDIETRRVVRQFEGHANKVLDMTWSGDARWLVTSSMDTTIRTWDVPTGRMIDWMTVPEPATSVSLSPTGEYLASTHVDSLGVHLWANRTLFSDYVISPISNEAAQAGNAPVAHLPQVARVQGGTSTSAEETAGADEADDDHGQPSQDDSEWKSPDQLSEELLTLSGLPRSRWENLSKLDLIKQRNKPLEPPKAPQHAPFFLSTVPGLTTTFKPQEDPLAAADTAKSSHVLNFGKYGVKSTFQRTLEETSVSGQYDRLLELLKSMGASAIDAEIRSLSTFGQAEDIENMLRFFNFALQTTHDFELVQAYMGLFLTVHGDVIVRHQRLSHLLESILDKQKEHRVKLEALFHHPLCLIQFFKTTTV